ncbi:MAG TPA: hypothetical protein P5572_07830 [Phycisphaerae bacterium]|nr:hypothetical protein [Phycisphaerae bacterium]
MSGTLIRWTRRACAAAWALCAVCALTAQASTVVPMDVKTLADDAGQVVVGRVASVRSYWADNPRRIESEVTLERVDYLKGRLADSSDAFTLIVPGGEVGKMRMTVCCAPELHVGEKWMLFLLPTYHTFPVVGIFQGAFLIQADADGVERVVSRTHGVETPVLGVGDDGFVQYAAAETADAREQLVAAHNMRLVTPQSRSASPVRYTDFVKQLAPVLTASRDYALTAPAGQPRIVQYQAVPLQMSRMEKRRAAERSGDEPRPELRGAGKARKLPAGNQPKTAGEEGQR